MTSKSIDWDEDLPADPEEEYQTFIRTLERTEGFRLLFVRCTPAEGEQLIARVKEELPQKTIEVLRLDEPIDNLYEIVEQLPNREQVNILFIQGLENSFYEYEQTKFGNNSERYSYSWKGVPQILNHLNQQRERFRDDFNICFVFLLRSFSLKYFIHRAPDFFDWRSSVFEFPTKPDILEKESSLCLQEGNFSKYLTLTYDERIKKFLEIQELLEENHQTSSYKASLLVELGKLFHTVKQYEAALASYDQALKLQPDYHNPWNYRGDALWNLGRYEEAIASYNQALKIKPDCYCAWNGRGDVLRALGQYEEALASYDKVLEIKPNSHYAWHNRGIALENIERYEEAVASFNKAQEIDPDCYVGWNDQGTILNKLGRYKKAIASFNKALEIKPDCHTAWHKRGDALLLLGRYEKAIASYNRAQEIDPNCYSCWNSRGNAMLLLGRYEEAITSYDKTLEIEQDNQEALLRRASILLILDRTQEAIASFEKFSEFKLDDSHYFTWFNRGILLLNKGFFKEAIISFKKVREIQPNFYQVLLQSLFKRGTITILWRVVRKSLKQF